MIVVLTCLALGGCASALSYMSSEDEIRSDRVMASGNKQGINALQAGTPPANAIHLVNLGNDGIGIGLDVSSWDAIAQHPLRQLGAAVLDAGTTYGAYLGATSLGGKHHTSTTSTAGRDNNTINISGTGNNVHVGDTTSTSTTSGQ